MLLMNNLAGVLPCTRRSLDSANTLEGHIEAPCRRKPRRQTCQPTLAKRERGGPCFSLASDSKHRVLLSEPDPPLCRSVFLILGPMVATVAPHNRFQILFYSKHLWH